jgi:tetratricopeptide (TPR) repeat protein
VTLSIAAILLLIGFTDVFAPFLDPSTVEGRRGAAAYRRGDGEAAFRHFQNAVTARPDAAAEMNLGTAAYAAGRYDEAGQAFGRAAGFPDAPRGAAAYNLGNARFKAEDLEGALAAYRAALRENPDDEDARWNYETTLRRMTQGPPEDQQRNRDSQSPSGDQNQRQPSSGDSTQASSSPQPDSGEEGRPSPSERASGEPGEQEPSPAEGQEQPGSPQQTGERPAQMLSPEEARRLLDAMVPEERELLRARLKAAHRKKTEKDW